MKEYYINNSNRKIHAKLSMPDKKTFPLAIVVHGLTGHMEEEHIVAVADTAKRCGYATLRVEMFGHGQSDGKFEDHDLLKWIDGMMCVIEHARNIEGVEQIVLIGHSQGGLLTMIMGGLFGDVLDAIIPMSPAILINTEAKEGKFFHEQVAENGAYPRVLEMPDRKLSGNYLRAATLFSIEDLIIRFQGPVLLIHGNEDQSVPYEDSVKASKMYSHARLETINGADHCYHGKVHEMVNALYPFLEEIIK